jgi:hypothetical protein
MGVRSRDRSGRQEAGSIPNRGGRKTASDDPARDANTPRSPSDRSIAVLDPADPAQDMGHVCEQKVTLTQVRIAELSEMRPLCYI